MGDDREEREELRLLVSSLKERVLTDRELGRPLSYVVPGKSALASEGRSLPVSEAPLGQRRTDEIAGGQKTALEAAREQLGDCRRCRLAESRSNIVFGEGNPHAALVFVGEAPGGDEDLQGKPFVGRAGQLLTKIIIAMGLERRDVYICNILKCRPPGNRNPLPEEIVSCEPFLISQLEAIKPRAICALGSFAARTLLKSETPITLLRGHFHDYQGIPLMPTYHPAYLLRNPGAKKQVWEDVQKIMELLRPRDATV
ncbi:MAG: uracil-DNA glycosylase [Syntrophobacterales bacterium]|nr:uracil-DNA glycosylase [Syntrophobacterales bacterium]